MQPARLASALSALSLSLLLFPAAIAAPPVQDIAPIQQPSPAAVAEEGGTTEAPPAAGLGAIAGRVSAELTGRSVAGTEVELVDLRRRVRVGEDGAFRFEAVPPGRHVLHAEGPVGHGLVSVGVAAGETATAEISVDITVMEEMVVSATPLARRQLDVAQPLTVLSGDELDQRRQATLGETLDEQAGVSSTYFGPGASRPVIRGFGGERIRTLQGGLGSADASATSPDHAVSADPLSAERIEILRGPATLLYGSSAVGGVVNVLDGRIPSYLPEAALSGQVELGAGTAADERAGAVSLGGGAGPFAWHADYSRRETGDVEIPDDATAEDGDPLGGRLENSALGTDGGALGVSWVGERGFLGVSASAFDTLYGVPAGHHHGDEEEEGEAVRTDLAQRRFDLRGERRFDAGVFQGAKLRVGAADYEHRELEGAAVGTRFENDSWEGRLELVQRRRGDLDGALGLQASSSDFVAVGEEAFVPPSVTDDLALFVFEELARGPLSYQFGLRWESRDVDPEGGLPARSFDGLSGSLGLVWSFAEAYSFTASLSRTERLPSATELFANGPHVATRAFEIGDPGLDAEDSLGLDLSLKTTSDRVTGALNLFVNRFDGFIYEDFTGLQRDGLTVVRFVQRDAEFTGAEADLLWRLAEVGDGHLDLRTRADWVRAELDDGTPLPRIPPLRLGLGLAFHQGPWQAEAEARRIEEQDRVAPGETPTGGHTLLNASVGYRLFAGATVVDLLLRGTNLTDEVARNHVSFLKDDVPLPGRDLSVSVRLTF
jgi:iron complex outermembrane recepter protein